MIAEILSVVRDPDGFSAFFLGSAPRGLVHFDSSSTRVVETVGPDTVRGVRDGSIRLLLLSAENPFSHMSNVLRRAALSSGGIVMVGRGPHLSALHEGADVTIDADMSLIIVGSTPFCYVAATGVDSARESIAYNLDTRELCYRPDYYYSNELGSIVAAGFESSGKHTGQSTAARMDEFGRVWVKGVGWPDDISHRILSSPAWYYKLLLEYANLLIELSKQSIMVDWNEFSSDLVRHFSYSAVFSFVTPSLAKHVVETEGATVLRAITSQYAMISPIADRRQSTPAALRAFSELLCILLTDGIPSKQFQDYFDDELWLTVRRGALLLFVTMYISDIRRCVVRNLQDDNEWFASICTHRARTDAY